MMPVMAGALQGFTLTASNADWTMLDLGSSTGVHGMNCVFTLVFGMGSTH